MRKFLTASVFALSFCFFTFGQNSVCPVISITGPSSVVQPGETATFTANVTGKIDESKLKYVWSVDKGKIIEGQRTSVITVITEGLEDMTITATVEIKGLPRDCPNTDSETAMSCDRRPSPILFDESELSSLWKDSAKLNAFISELENNPEDTGYLIIYPHKKDSPDDIRIKEDYIRNYLIANKIKSERLIFVSAGDNEYESEKSVIRMWRVPQGAEPPTP